MDAVFKIDVGCILDGRGVSTITLKGERVMVDGEPMVRVAHGTIVRSAEWSDTEREARVRAAMKIEQMGRTLLVQAEQMRASAETDK